MAARLTNITRPAPIAEMSAYMAITPSQCAIRTSFGRRARAKGLRRQTARAPGHLATASAHLNERVASSERAARHRR
jgi:hypothetical protein